MKIKIAKIRGTICASGFFIVIKVDKVTCPISVSLSIKRELVRQQHKRSDII